MREERERGERREERERERERGREGGGGGREGGREGGRDSVIRLIILIVKISKGLDANSFPYQMLVLLIIYSM